MLASCRSAARGVVGGLMRRSSPALTAQRREFSNERQEVKFYLISFADLYGVQRAKLVPRAAIDSMSRDGAGFAAFAAHFDSCPSDPDLLAIPDPDQSTVLPWQPDVAWMPSDLIMNGKPFEQCPRLALRRQMERAEEQGYIFKTGAECEFMLLDAADPSQPSDSRDTTTKPCYEQTAVMRRFDFIGQLMDMMESLGWGPYQADHEDANGQFEINWEYDNALVTADRVQFCKYMVTSMAEQHGFRATFMPKPFEDKTGNGMHMHLSLHEKGHENERNLFKPEDGGEGEFITPLGSHFLGGLTKHATALTAIGNPTVNSYKRLGAAAPSSGATWAPAGISHGGNDRTHTIRIPDAPRLEFRLGDMAANPYLYSAAVLAAGLDGIENKEDPGPQATVPAWELKDAPPLPANLPEALKHLEGNSVLNSALGPELTAAFQKLGAQQWREYSAHLTQWELDNYL